MRRRALLTALVGFFGATISKKAGAGIIEPLPLKKSTDLRDRLADTFAAWYQDTGNTSPLSVEIKMGEPHKKTGHFLVRPSHIQYWEDPS